MCLNAGLAITGKDGSAVQAGTERKSYCNLHKAFSNNMHSSDGAYGAHCCNKTQASLPRHVKMVNKQLPWSLSLKLGTLYQLFIYYMHNYIFRAELPTRK